MSNLSGILEAAVEATMCVLLYQMAICSHASAHTYSAAELVDSINISLHV